MLEVLRCCCSTFYFHCRLSLPSMTIRAHPAFCVTQLTFPKTSRTADAFLCRPVGSGKTALMLELCRTLRDSYNIAAVTNDIFTREDAEYLTDNKALPPDRIRAIQTGGCPHAAIREDISENYHALKELHAKFQTDLLLIESGGDNLAANYSRELADYIIYVIDVAGGDKVPRKGGPGTTGSDLLVINKCDLAKAVGANLERMEREAKLIREGGPVIMAVVKDTNPRPAGYENCLKEIVGLILSAWKSSDAYALSMKRWKNGAPRNSGPISA